MGGPNAPISLNESIDAMVKVIETTNINDTGRFFNFDGKDLPW